MTENLEPGDPATHDRVVEELRAGRLVVMATDSVYGLMADAFQPTATRRLLRARGAGRNRPLTVLIRSERQVVGLAGEVSEAADRLIAAYWPGPLTLILQATPGLTWDLGNTMGTVALRIPTDDAVLSVIKDVGPLACSGAGRRGRELPTTVQSAQDQLGNVVACYVDGGQRTGEVSTIVDAREERVEVLRVGAIPAEHIERVASGELEWGARPEQPEAADAEDAQAVSADEPEAVSGEEDEVAGEKPGAVGEQAGLTTAEADANERGTTSEGKQCGADDPESDPRDSLAENER